MLQKRQFKSIHKKVEDTNVQHKDLIRLELEMEERLEKKRIRQQTTRRYVGEIATATDTPKNIHLAIPHRKKTNLTNKYPLKVGKKSCTTARFYCLSKSVGFEKSRRTPSCRKKHLNWVICVTVWNRRKSCIF